MNDEEVFCNHGKFSIIKNVVGNIPFLRKLNIKRREVAFLRAFERYVEKHGFPDFIHAQSCAFSNAGYIASIIRRKYNIPYIITEHASVFITEKRIFLILINVKRLI
ncbi:hypothetical protein CRG86_010160 [Photobacterium leiognathi]|nr:hypothetical protein CRG86_010160 [Photobacterium leiognathi]